MHATYWMGIGLMTGIEKRKNERYPLNRQLDGRLFLRTGPVRHLVKNIRDISSSGISVTLEHDYSKMTDVKVEYLSESGKIEVFGKVVWCAPDTSESNNHGEMNLYILGIELLSSMLLVSVLQQHATTGI